MPKKCKTCKEILTEKNASPSQVLGGGHCRPCRKVKNRSAYEANRDYWRDWYLDHRELTLARVAENIKANPERRKRESARRSQRVATQRCNPLCVPATQRQISLVFGHKGVALCASCGGVSGHVDHVLAVSRGGCSCLRNLQLLCAPCNWRKGSDG